MKLPDPVAAGDVGWGRTVEFIPPAVDGFFRVDSDTELRARPVVFDAPPEPFPEGLAAFTLIVGIWRSNLDVPSEVALTLRVAPGVCDPANLGRLKLYAYDRKAGWFALPVQTAKPEERAFSGFDAPPRLYVVLGPAECLAAAPPRPG